MDPLDRVSWFKMSEAASPAETDGSITNLTEGASSPTPITLLPQQKILASGQVWGFIPEQGRWYQMSEEQAVRNGWDYQDSPATGGPATGGPPVSPIVPGEFTGSVAWRIYWTRCPRSILLQAPGEHGYQPLNEEFGWNPQGDFPRPGSWIHSKN